MHLCLPVSRGFLFAWILVSFACHLASTQGAPEGNSLFSLSSGRQKRAEENLRTRVADIHTISWNASAQFSHPENGANHRPKPLESVRVGRAACRTVLVFSSV